MFDLHMHTCHSDGSLSVMELLKEAQKAGLKYISITDHNTVDAYNEIEDGLFSGKIITGIEIECNFDGCLIEVLGYGINIEKIKNNNIMKKYFPLSMKEYYIKKLNKYKTICTDLGIKFSENLQLKAGDIYANRSLIRDLIKYPENELALKKLGITSNETAEDEFLNKQIYNDKSPFYDNYWFSKKPTLQDAVDIIKSAGGLVFLAHPFIFKIAGTELLEKLLPLRLLDGVECVNRKHSVEQIDYLIDFCNRNNLLKSGGSDFHRPIEHTMGHGNSGTYPIGKNITGELIAIIDK